MMRWYREIAGALAILAFAHLACAQETDAGEDTPSHAADAPQQRITPANGERDSDGMLSTHAVKVTVEPAATVKPSEKSSESNFKPFVSTPTSAPAMPAKSPFGHMDKPSGPPVPSGPHATEAVPVGNVDAIEASEPAPPTPVAPGADPVKEDPAAATEFNSPMFEGLKDAGLPRKIVLRALNKVTAQSTLFKVKPGETVRFGQLQITAVMCHTSLPTSQTDYAGLLDIKEQLPGKDVMVNKASLKPIFHGWMYASSPSVAALEHPIYDVTMVSCDIAQPTPKEEPAPAKKVEKKVLINGKKQP